MDEAGFIKKDRLVSKLVLFNEIILVAVLIIISAAISIGTPKFYSTTNILNILRDSSMAIIAGIGMTMLLITGEVDLSIGSLVAFVGVVTMDITNKTMNVPLGVIAGMGLGATVGLINGLVRTKLKVNSLIGTIAMMMILRGGVYIYRIAAVQNYHQLRAFYEIGNGYVGFMPIPILIMIVIYFAFLLIVNRSVMGRHLYATGGNYTAAKISGIKVDNLKILTFVMNSTFAAISGIILVSRMNSGQPNAGVGFELSVISGVILGGTSLGGGEGTLIGTLIGVLILRVINNGIIILRWNQDLQIVISGIVIIIAVFIDTKRKVARSKIITT
ncbi:MAG: ABC transporter permease [Spirochaetes bacterium]|nr:ABC transporter permease [Spirochaetota bacterium]